MTEAQIQTQVAAYLRMRHPGIVFTATLGGLRLTPGVVRKIKAAGYHNGIPDLLILAPRGRYHGMALELKSDKGRPSVEQINTIRKLTDAGYYCAITYGAREPIEQIMYYFGEDTHA